MRFILLLTIGLLIACKSDKKFHGEPLAIEGVSEKMKGILEFQSKYDAMFKDPEASPLPDRFRKDFEGLEYYNADTTYVVNAVLERTPDAVPFKMSTTTDEQRNEVVFGIAHFELNGKSHQLEIYRSADEGEAEVGDYLFLPFLDETNGNETYGGGRYIELEVPSGDSITIDFNRAFNPYCVYNKKYSCPLVPRQNYLRTNVRAGVKDFEKD